MSHDSEPDNRNPREGDVISAWFQWSQDGDTTPRSKIRPCLIVKVAPDASSIVVAPISTRRDWIANDCLEIPREQSAEAGLDTDIRKWVKLTEINRIDLPSSAIAPRIDEDGRLQWRRGRVSDAILKDVQREIAHRVQEGTLTGRRITRENGLSARISTAAKATPEARADHTDRHMPGTLTDEARITRLRAAAAERLRSTRRTSAPMRSANSAMTLD